MHIVKEFLYLETGTIPIKYMLAHRRIKYLKHILRRDANELIRKIYTAQQNQPTTRGDFVVLVKQDLDWDWEFHMKKQHPQICQRKFSNPMQ